MKRLGLMLVVVAILLAPVQASCGGLGAYGIWWNPDDGDDMGGFGLMTRIPLVPLISMDARASWVSGNGADVFPLEGTATASLGMFYGGIGLGYYIFSGDHTPDDEFGWYLLGGISLIPGPVSVFGEIKWQEIDAGLDGLGFHAGVTFRM